MKVKCKKSFGNHVFHFKKENYYKIYDEDKKFYLIMDYVGNNVCLMKKKSSSDIFMYFDEFFYSIKELRKFKINKILKDESKM